MFNSLERISPSLSGSLCATRQLRKIASIAAVLAVSAAWSSQASAVVIFSDDFNRANSNTVGNGWVENPDVGGNKAIILNNELRLVGNQDPTVTQVGMTLSTLGLTNIQLSYKWAGFNSESDDFLRVSWSQNGTTFTELVAHALNASTLTMNMVGLGPTANNQADIQIRFRLNANMGNDEARVDDVLLTGDRVNNIPEPGAMALFGFGLAALGFARRKRMVSLV